jgi:hypothetical protein
MSGSGSNSLRMLCPQTEGAKTSHRQACDKNRRGLSEAWGGHSRRCRYLIYDPPFEVLRSVCQVATSISPKAVAGHRQYHRRDRTFFGKSRGGEVGPSFKRPCPVASINPVEKNHQGWIACLFGSLARVHAQVCALREGRTFYRHTAQAVPFKSWV